MDVQRLLCSHNHHNTSTHSPSPYNYVQSLALPDLLSSYLCPLPPSASPLSPFRPSINPSPQFYSFLSESTFSTFIPRLSSSPCNSYLSFPLQSSMKPSFSLHLIYLSIIAIFRKKRDNGGLEAIHLSFIRLKLYAQERQKGQRGEKQAGVRG